MTNKPGKTLLFYLLLSFAVFAALTASSRIESQGGIPNKEDSLGAHTASLRITDIVCSYVEKLYVNPNSIDPEKMLLNAMGRLEKTIPELLVEFNEVTKTVTISVDNDTIALKTSGLLSLKDTGLALKKAFVFIARNQENDKISQDDIMYDGLNGMLSKLDPHTVVLPPKDFNEFKIGTSGQFGGLGMVVGVRDGILTVISPIEGTPAYEAGLNAGDQITEIDGESTINMTLSESVGKLRGKPNSYVTLSVLKYRSSTAKTISIERKIIKIPTVDDKVLEDGIGYIKIRNFQNDTADALSEHIKNLKMDDKPVRGMIIDLRNNSGGLLDQAIKVTDQFIDSGNIVVTVGPGGKNRDVQRAGKSRSDELAFPIVLLINSSSASGAEIVVGALKENNRGVVIGNRSFGKGTVQQLINLIDGAALKLTMAKYLTPLFNEVQARGISPDILFTPVTISDDNIDLFKKRSYIREEDLLNHGDNSSSTNTVTQKDKTTKEIKYLLESIEDPAVGDGDGDDEGEPAFVDEDPYKTGDLSNDRLVQFAKLLIKHTHEYERNAILNDITQLLTNVEEEEERKIAAALKGIGVDWSPGSAEGVPKPEANMSIKLSQGKHDNRTKRDVTVVQAGEEVTATLSVRNNGSGTMYKTRAITESKNSYLDNLEFVFGKIGSGESKEYSKTIEIPKNAIDREDEIAVTFHEEYGFAPDKLTGVVRIASLNKPRFAYSYQVTDKGSEGDSGNNDGLIQNGEDIRLTLIIRNIGEHKAEKTLVSLKNVSEDAIFVEKGREDIGDLLPGETKIVDMEFRVKKEATFDAFSLDVLVRESTFGSYIISTLTLPVMNDTALHRLSTAASTLTVKDDNTPVSGVRWETGDQLTFLDKGAIVMSDGMDDDLYRIELPRHNFGWVAKKHVRDVGADKHVGIKSIALSMRHVPPSINVDTHKMELLADSNQFVLSGYVSDDRAVENVYAFVNDEKVFYRSKSTEHGTKQTKGNSTQQGNVLDFHAEILLKDGPNNITIIARDDDGLVNRKSFVVTRKKHETATDNASLTKNDGSLGNGS